MSAIADLFPEVVPTPDENRRYTTRELMAFARCVAEVDAWDLDPAADEESHHAPRWFAAPGDHAPNAAGLDGLRQSWAPTAEWAAGVEERRASAWRASPPVRTWRIFINPPFDNLGPWVERVWKHLYEDRGTARELGLNALFYRVAMVLPGNRGEQPFWQAHVEPYLAGHKYAGRYGYQLTAHHPPGRQAYGYPGNPLGIGSASATPWPTVVLVWRRS